MISDKFKEIILCKQIFNILKINEINTFAYLKSN